MSAIWTVWNRDHTKVLGNGRTFDEAKQKAAAAGESSVLLSKTSPGRHWSYVVAVFISLVPGFSTSLDASSAADEGGTSISSSLSADVSADQADEDEWDGD